MGSACNQPNDCTTGICVDQTCQDGTPGSPCNSITDCVNGFCVNQLCSD